MKIKKLAKQSRPENQPPYNVDWTKNENKGKDIDSLREECSWLKQMLNETEEEKRILKASAEKYERRAKYTLEKFNEIKAKEMELIQIGEAKMKGEIHIQADKFKKKLQKVEAKLKEVQEENNQMKRTKLNQNRTTQYRLELEKSEAMVVKLHEKIKKLQAQSNDSQS